MSRTIRLELVLVAAAMASLTACKKAANCPDGQMLVDGLCVTPGDAGVPPTMADGSVPTDGGEADGCVPTDEACNGVDDDCDGAIDEALTRECGMTEGTCTMGEATCSEGEWSACSGVAPSESEACDGLDDDCDGMVDETCTCTPGDTQACGTAVGECSQGTQTCSGDASWGDCEGAILPDAELCDGLDNDCDGVVDNGNPGGGASCGSSVGECAAGVEVCMGGSLICAGATGPTEETCDERDNDCDGSTDEGVTLPFYLDADGDGRGVAGSRVDACSAPAGYASAAGDCDDGNDAIYPGASDICDGEDNDCSGPLGVDSTFACVQHATVACTTSCGTTGTGSCTGSCGLPTGSACAPPAETCNRIDDDCDGLIDDGVTSLGALRTAASTDVDDVRLVKRSLGFVLYTLSGTTLRAQSLDSEGIPLGSVTTVDTQVSAFDATPISGTHSMVFYRYLGDVFARRVTAGTSISVGSEVVIEDDAHGFVSGVAVAASSSEVFYAYVQASTRFVRLVRTNTYGGALQSRTYGRRVDGSTLTEVDLNSSNGLITLGLADDEGQIRVGQVNRSTLGVSNVTIVGPGSDPVLADDELGNRAISYVSGGRLYTQFIDAGSWTVRGRLVGLPAVRTGFPVADATTTSYRQTGAAFDGGRWIFASRTGNQVTLTDIATSGLQIASDARSYSYARGVDLAANDNGTAVAVARAVATGARFYGCH